MLIRTLALVGLLALGTAEPALGQQRDTTSLGVTLAAFQAIRPGMTVQQVEAIIGRPGVAGIRLPDIPTVAYRWTEESPFRNIVVGFSDGRARIATELYLYPQTTGTVTLEQFQRLREGMTLQEVRSILGGPGEYKGFTPVRGELRYNYHWRGRAPDTGVRASFLNDLLTGTPTQYGMQ